MKIIQLTSENIKRLKAVEITPSDNIVTLTGKNGSGKTSILDSILYAFAGKDAIPGRPIRDGEETARVEIDCGEFVITRTFNEKGTYLTIVTKDGDIKRSPQTFLNNIVGKISFDPMDFINRKPKEQADILANLVNINIEEFDSKYQRLYQERTDTGRQSKPLAAKLSGMSLHKDAPEREVNSKDLFDELDAVREHNRKIEEKANVAGNLETNIKTSRQTLERLEAEAQEIKKHIKQGEDQLAQFKKELEGSILKDEEEVRRKIDSLDTANRMYRENAAYSEVKKEADKYSELYETQTKQLEGIIKAKAEALKNATFPIEGLSIGDGVVEFNGIPLEQISAAEKIKVGLSVSMALNPKLKVLRITDGSLLDSDSMAVISELAKDNDYQVWIEKVDESGTVGIYIEEGEIKQPKGGEAEKTNSKTTKNDS